MGRVKQDDLEHWSHGLTSVPERLVCYRHFKDYALKEFIKANGNDGKCSYCKKSTVVELETLMFYMMKGIMHFYEDAAQFMAYDGEYLGNTFTQEELINDEVGLEVNNDELREDIINSIDDRAWAAPNSYWDNHKDILVYHWSYFKDIVKHQARFLFAQTTRLKSFDYQLSPYRILEDIGRYISEFQMTTRLPLNTIVCRCRQHEDKEMISTAEQMSAPPLDKATVANRMSPAGIPMFYCAFDNITARLETVDTSDQLKTKVTICNFRTKRSLKVVDFQKLPKRPSMFDIDNFPNYYPLQFLHEFVEDLAKGIKHDGKEHIEYVPTQILTEYFRYIYPDEISGIIYPSSKRKGFSSCVLFFDQEESLTNLYCLIKSLATDNL
jgi:hypothetical protein